MNRYIYIGNGGQVLSVMGIPVADSFTRVVQGGRGDYVEFEHVFPEAIFIPEYAEYRLSNKAVYYIEYRMVVGNYMVYFQKRVVTYADYKLGMYYISPVYLKDFTVGGKR